MATGRRATIIRILKPLAAGLALAYLVTAFVDRPAPVHFQPENPYASKQAEIIEPQAEMVMDKNIMKLGSPLSVQPEKSSEPINPLVRIGEGDVEAPDLDSAASSEFVDNATDGTMGNSTFSVSGEVQN